MANMKIANRYRPFSHEPGSACLIPGTFIQVTAYPAAVVIQDPSGQKRQIEWHLTGLIKEFTLMQDLERQEVLIHGIAKEGFFSYKIFSYENTIVLKLERASQKHLKGKMFTSGLQESEGVIELKLKECFPLFESFTPSFGKEKLEKISFGNHKAQDWDLVLRRKNPLEYLPFWFALGQVSPYVKLDSLEKPGVLKQLELCKEALTHEENLGLETLKEIFEVGFKQILLPTLYDERFLGLSNARSLEKKEEKNTSIEMALLREGYHLIRKMLLEVKEGVIKILPHLPAAFHAGRCLNFQCQQAKVDIEWSKKLLKKVTITSLEAQTLHFSFQKPLKSYRLRTSSTTKGKEILCSEPIVLEKGVYILDQFKK